MTAILKPIAFLLIIVAAYLVKRAGLFKPRDYRVMQVVVFDFTLPASIIVSFATNPHHLSMLLISVFAIVFGLLPLLLVYAATRHKPVADRAFLMLNCSGFNIGNFCFPVIQAFMGPSALVTASMFAIGNTVIVPAGSCTTNSMAAMVKLLDENWGIKAGFMTTIHAYTGTQMILDGPRFPKARNNRAAAINTIPHSTGAAKAIGKVVPSVNGKLQGHAQRIQVPDGSVTELTTVLNKEVTADEINAAFKAAFSDTDFYGYNEDGIVSSDIIGDTHGGVFDPTQTDVNTVDGLTMARTVSWYDNEYGFTCNMVRTLLYFAEISE